ncbi:MAG TPA: hypothetical protein VMV04_01320 [Thermodesulfobacteriota bacterium]|nr:hypothetical protein [Thermodesulfobacteriota bacterium]
MDCLFIEEEYSILCSELQNSIRNIRETKIEEQDYKEVLNGIVLHDFFKTADVGD